MKTKTKIEWKFFVLLTLVEVVFYLALTWNSPGKMGQHEDRSLENMRPLKTIESSEEFDRVLKQKAVVLFFDADWSATTVVSRPMVIRFQHAADYDRRFAGVCFRRLDCTEQNGALWHALSKWLSDQLDTTRYAIEGNGSIVWIQEGKAVETVQCVLNENVDNLLSITHKKFAAK